MRKFYLENEIGERIDLNISKHSFEEPEGLGAENENTYAELGDGFFVNVKSQIKPINITGKISFQDEDQNADYDDFINWIFKGYKLYFIKSYGGTEYYCDIDVDYINKGEIEDGELLCPASFTGTTLWYTLNTIVLNFALDDESKYKKYPYKYPYKYSRSSSSKKVQITPIGHVPARVRLQAVGEMSNPSLTLTNENTGEILGKLDLSGLSVAVDEMLIYSSVPGNAYIKKVTDDGSEVDLSDAINLDYDNFLKLPLNVPCVIHFEFTGSADAATLYVCQYRR